MIFILILTGREQCSNTAYNALSITRRSIALELNVIMVIRPACVCMVMRHEGIMQSGGGSPCICVSEYMSALASVSACVSTVAIRCIMHVWRACGMLMMSDTPLMNV